MSTGVLSGDRWAHRIHPILDDIEDAGAAAAVPASTPSDSMAAPSRIASRALCR